MDRVSSRKERDQMNPDIAVTYFITVLPRLSNFGSVFFIQGIKYKVFIQDIK